MTKGRDVITSTEQILESTVRQAEADRRIIEMLHISNTTAAEVRRQIFAYAAEKVREDAE